MKVVIEIDGIDDPLAMRLFIAAVKELEQAMDRWGTSSQVHIEYDDGVVTHEHKNGKFLPDGNSLVSYENAMAAAREILG